MVKLTWQKNIKPINTIPNILEIDPVINSIPEFPERDPAINILVIPLYKLKKSGLVGDVDVYDKYKQCFNKCIQSYLSHNPTLFDKIIILENNENARENNYMNYNVINKIKKIWFTQKCNMLFVDLDTICHGKLNDIFSLNKFTMFGSGSALYNEFNSGILFFPRTMDIQLWNIFDTLIKTYDFTKYSESQYIWDKIFRSQFNSEHEAYEYVNSIGFGKYNWFHGLRNPYGNVIPEQYAIIKHYFASRGIDNLINIYQHFDDITIEFNYETL